MINLYDYQKDIVSFMENIEKDDTSGGMLCVDMGLGKSFTSLGLIFRNTGEDESKSTLIVVPKTLLYNWEQEYKRYQEGRPEITFKNYYGLNTKEQTFEENIILTTYDSVMLNYEYVQNKFYRIILDESQNIRNHKNKISKQVVNLKGFKKWCLSGTPFFNNYNDMYAQCLFLGKYDDKEKWRKPTEKFLEEFRKEICYILKKEDVLVGDKALPKIEHKKIQIELNDSEKNVYNKFKNMMNEGGNTLTYLIKIRQTCCNMKVMTKKENRCSLCTYMTKNRYRCGHYICESCYGRRGGSRKKMATKKCCVCKVDSTKFEKIVEILKSIPKEEKMVIFTQWKNMADLLKTFLRRKKIGSHTIDGSVSLKNRNSIIENFKQNDKKVLIATIQTCGVGINLTCANHVILIDSWWNASLEKQAIDRLYRIGQKREVKVYHIMIKDTVERWINFKQRQKKIQDKILFDKHNEKYKWLGESYGIYSKKKTKEEKKMRTSRYLSNKRMSTLALSSCLDREKMITNKYLVNKEDEILKEKLPLMMKEIFVKYNEPTYWDLRNHASLRIQRFFKRIVMKKRLTRKGLEKELPDELIDIIIDFIHPKSKSTQYFNKINI